MTSILLSIRTTGYLKDKKATQKQQQKIGKETKNFCGGRFIIKI